MGKEQLESDKKNTFQTPLPLLRFANKSNGVDPRLQKLLGGAIPQKNLAGGVGMNNLAGGGEVQPSDAMKQRLGLANNLANKANHIKNIAAEAATKQIQKGVMTPALTSSNQFHHR